MCQPGTATFSMRSQVGLINVLISLKTCILYLLCLSVFNTKMSGCSELCYWLLTGDMI